MSALQRVTPVVSLASLAARTFASAATKKTTLYDLHVAAGGKMVDFAGTYLAVEYKEGVLKSHFHSRKAASLFDVSHMGQIHWYGKDRLKFLEWVSPCDLKSLKKDQAKLTSLPNYRGGLIDDTIMTRRDDHVFEVINGACVQKDLAWFRDRMAEFKAKGGDVSLEVMDRTLVALQGPKAHVALQALVNVDLSKIPFMYCFDARVAGVPCVVSRLGYTGEDGFEIAMPHNKAVQITQAILDRPEVLPAGLAVRDCLRLEAGLCLYGHELNDDITPIEGDLLWTITKRRRVEGGFIAWEKLFQKNGKPKPYTKKRVGLKINGPPAREGVEIRDLNGKKVGTVTSGTFSPILNYPVSMGYVPVNLSKPGTKVLCHMRGKNVPATVVKTPFVPNRYFRVKN